MEFNGHLRDEQPLALEQLLHHDTGILSGTTAFGKTVVAIKLIAERKVNTLILVDKVSLLKQWQERLSDFLIINETLPEMADYRGQEKRAQEKNKRHWPDGCRQKSPEWYCGYCRYAISKPKGRGKKLC